MSPVIQVEVLGFLDAVVVSLRESRGTTASILVIGKVSRAIKGLVSAVFVACLRR
jgi:hypothetical protein